MLSKFSKCFSFAASRDWLYRHSFTVSGLRSVVTDLGDGTTMHCWVPKLHKPCKPTLVLVHGFGANAMWQYGEHLRHFITHFNVYVPDLLFFGESFTSRPERTESFQAVCLVKLMEAHGVHRMSLVGISYGGFVGYSVAAQFPEVVERLVLCCAGVCLEEIDMKNGLFRVSNLDEASSILLPQTPDKLRELMRLSFVRPARGVPSWFLEDFIHVMCTDHIEQKRELLDAILKDRQLSNLPMIKQPTLVMWGEQDQIFPLELGHRLKRHIGENAEMVIIKNAGHAVNLEKPKEFARHLKSFLIDAESCPHSSLSFREQIQKTLSFDLIRYWSGRGALAWCVALLLQPIFETKLFVMLGIHAPNQVDIINTWIQQWLSCKEPAAVQLFCATLWKIWAARNQLLFQKRAIDPVEVAGDALDAVTEYNQAIKKPEIQQSASPPRQTAAPAPDFVVFSVDAGCFNDSSTAWGLSARGSRGTTLLEACKAENLVMDPVLAEAIGVRWCLQIARDHQSPKIIIESDALVVVNCINGSSFRADIELVVNDCKFLMNSFEEASVSYIRRSLNLKAHNLVGLAKRVGSRTWLGNAPYMPLQNNCNAHVQA